MIPATITGIPTHLLVIHAVVVLVPLGALGAIVLAAFVRTRPCLRWPVLFVLSAALAAVPVATRTGEALKERLVAEQLLAGAALEKVTLHEELGELVLWPMLALWLLSVVLVLLDPTGRRRGRLVAVVAVLAVVAATAATVQTVRAGHAGSTAVWNPGA